MSKFRVGYQQHAEFAHSTLWQDYCAEVNAWLENIKDQFETAESLDDIRQLQGAIRACRYFLALPQTILEQLLDNDVTEEYTNGRN